MTVVEFPADCASEKIDMQIKETIRKAARSDFTQEANMHSS